MPARILIADDNQEMSQLLEYILQEEGYTVEVAHDGDELVRKAQSHVPDLILIDVLMPYMDGFEAIRQLRNDTRLSHLPMILLTARSSIDDVVTGFATGADDYITKPFQIQELLARIRAQLSRASRRPVLNPLTGLPGNTLIEQEIKHRLRSDVPFALLYVDLNHFKAFNDTYGFARGDQVITLAAQLLTHLRAEMGQANIFVGHIGGDDFIVVLNADQAVPFAAQLIEQFDQQVPSLYDLDDVARGYLRRIDRFNATRRFPIQTVAIGIVLNNGDRFDSYESMSRVAAEMKYLAKTRPGSNYVIDQRSRQEKVAQDRRSRERNPSVLLIGGADHALHQRLTATLKHHGYQVDSMAQPVTLPERPDLITLLFPPNLELVRTTQQLWAHVPIIVVSEQRTHEDEILALGVAAFLRVPITPEDYVALVGQVLRLEAR